MLYKLHRVAPNGHRWECPSAGRIQMPGAGAHVQQHGFGHEDWNFNFDFAENGMMLGYTVARPSSKHLDKEFRVILATYVSPDWLAVGYYDGATFRETLSTSRMALPRMAADVFELARQKSVSPEYWVLSLSAIEKKIYKEFQYHCWEIPRDKVFVFPRPLRISPRVFQPGRQRMVTSYDIDEKKFRKIVEGKETVSNCSDTVNAEEGRKYLRAHMAIERSRKLIEIFKSRLTNHRCAVCNFDFEAVYGHLGHNFIECHHTLPVSQMHPGDVTQLKDLRAVCSNCHRMLHRKDDLTIEGLRRIIGLFSQD